MLKILIRKSLSLVVLLLLLVNSIEAATTTTKTITTTIVEKEEPNSKEKLPVFYDLVQDNLKPDSDEFYLSMIFGSRDKPQAFIKRSNNSRAGEIYSESVAYGVGDAISDDYVIDAIDFRTKEVVVKKIATGEYYSLLLSYGTATSRLTKKLNYKNSSPKL